MNRLSTTPSALKTLDAILAHWKIPDDWDLLIVSDGSGNAWSNGCGWATCMLDRVQGLWVPIVGGQNIGTIAMGEMLGVWMAIRYHRATLRQSNRLSLYRCHVFSDSQSTVSMGNGEAVIRENVDLWSGFEKAVRGAYIIRWHFVDKRLQFPLHALVDQHSAAARDYMLNFDPARSLDPNVLMAGTAVPSALNLETVT